MSESQPNSAVLSSRPVGPGAVDELSCTFREAMAHLVAPVTVVTASRDDGVPVGTTVSAAMSLSMTPELFGVALSLDSSTLEVVRQSRRFGINILSAAQAGVALVFAGKGDAKFAGVEWHEEAGIPRLAGMSVWVRCSVQDLVPAGDHILVIGAVEASARADGLPPLAYHARSFGTHDPAR